jgi:hypothetical protein
MNKASLIEYIKQLLNILEKEEQDEFADLPNWSEQDDLPYEFNREESENEIAKIRNDIRLKNYWKK